MSRSDPRLSPLLPRTADLSVLFAAVREASCVSVVGVSNLGKSALLRSMTEEATQAEYLGADAADYVFVYADYNQMLEMSEQAFYELLLRCSLDALHRCSCDPDVIRQVEAAYTGLVAPATSFEVPLRFAQAMAAIGDLLPQRFVFLFDELDGPLMEIDGRVFLNLRALKDKHWQGLTYITATNRRLGQIRQEPDVLEFEELFAHHTHYISLLTDEEMAAFVTRVSDAEGITYSDNDLTFIRLWAGGHPGLLEAISRVLGLLTGRPVRDPSQDWIIHRRTSEILQHDLNTQSECRRIWNDLDEGEREALIEVLRPQDGQSPSPELEAVAAKHLVLGEGPERRLFARSFADFVARQQVARRSGRSGIHVDPESGEVWVNDVQIPTLTNLEYRLLLLLYGRLGKICTKYEVVEAVWGEDYIDEVDDARIEKLVSRLRGKIEPDAANPKYLLTIRGRGYKLAEG